MKLTNQRTISQINQKIENGEANIYTAEEFKKLIKEGLGDVMDYYEIDNYDNKVLSFEDIIEDND